MEPKISSTNDTVKMPDMIGIAASKVVYQKTTERKVIQIPFQNANVTGYFWLCVVSVI